MPLAVIAICDSRQVRSLFLLARVVTLASAAALAWFGVWAMVGLALTVFVLAWLPGRPALGTLILLVGGLVIVVVMVAAVVMLT